MKRYKGIVTDNNDPDKLGRLKVRCDAFFEEDLPDWVDPMFPYTGSKGVGGFFFIPPVGSAVLVDIHEDYDDMTSLQAYWTASSITTENKLSTKFSGSYGKIQGIETPSGGVYFDASTGAETVKLEHKGGFCLEMNKDKVIITVGSNKVEVLQTGAITISGSGQVEIKGGTVKIGDNVTIDGKAFLTHTHIGAPATITCGAPGAVVTLAGNTGVVA